MGRVVIYIYIYIGSWWVFNVKVGSHVRNLFWLCICCIFFGRFSGEAAGMAASTLPSFVSLHPWSNMLELSRVLDITPFMHCMLYSWLVVWTHLKNMKVSWDQKCSKPPTRLYFSGEYYDICIYIYIYIYRRKFRSQTSDNMDRWKAEQGRGREKRKIRRKKSRRERVRRKKMQMREKVGKSRNTVFFQWFVAPEGRKVGF